MVFQELLKRLLTRHSLLLLRVPVFIPRYASYRKGSLEVPNQAQRLASAQVRYRENREITSHHDDRENKTECPLKPVEKFPLEGMHVHGENTHVATLEEDHLADVAGVDRDEEVDKPADQDGVAHPFACHQGAVTEGEDRC